MNIKLKEGFSQVCIWQGCIVINDETLNLSSEDKINRVNEFEKIMSEQFYGTRVQYLEEIKTGPDYDSQGKIVEGTGNRNDLFFAVHNDDIAKFAVPRLAVGIRWIEDVLALGNYDYTSNIYPDRIFDYVTWNKEFIKFPNNG